MKIIAKIIIIVAIFLGGLVIGRATVAPLTPTNYPAGEVQANNITVSLMLDEGDATIKTFADIKVAVGASVFDVLKKITDEKKIELSYKDYGGDLGVLVQSIDHKTGDTKKNLFWQYWVNNSLANIGVSNFHLKNGDVIEWKYIKDQFFN